MLAAGLYVVATPIGNLGDLSPRAQEVLQAADLITAEDTRHSKKLLDHFAITTPLLAYHDHSEQKTLDRILQRLQGGERVALISDAGTPLISDPGYRLVSLAREKGYSVVPVPGPSALTAALSVAGLPSDRFVFEGFLSAKSGARDKRLQQLVGETRTLIFYESPHRIHDCLKAMLQQFGGEREAYLGREISKQFESHFRGTLNQALTWIEADDNNRRGEFVVVLAGRDEVDIRQERDRQALQIVTALLAEMPLKKAVAIACEISGARKNSVYDAALELAGKQVSE